MATTDTEQGRGTFAATDRLRDELLLDVVALLEGLHTPEEADRQLEQLRAALIAAGEGVHDRRADVLRLVAVETDLLDPVPQATLAQARRRAQRRRRLLASGAYDIDALAELRGSSTTAVTTWLGRMRDQQRLISVTDRDGRTWAPALLLDTSTDPVQPRSGAEEVLGPLLDAGLDPWAVWVWLTAPSGWLDGAVPADLLRTGATQSAADGARRFTGARGRPEAA